MEKAKILFVCQEITPYLPETEMSHICRYLPQAMQESGYEIRAFMPKYGLINERRNQLHEVIRLSGMNMIIDDTDHPLIIKVASIQSARFQVYFIDNDDYFSRKYKLKDKNGLPFPDNDERTIFFVRGVLETVKKLRWSPTIVHLHGWVSALTALYLRKSFREDPLFHNCKIVYSVYDDDFSKPMNKAFKNKAKFDGVTEKDVNVLEDPTFLNLSKLAINLSDGVIYGHPNINPDVKAYAEASKKPILEYHPVETYLDAYQNFYNKILE
jgi:starch synthase